MKKNVNFPINEKKKNEAKQHSRIEGKYFSTYCEEAFQAGVELKEFCRANSVTVEDVIYYLNNSISGTQIKAAQR